MSRRLDDHGGTLENGIHSPREKNGAELDDSICLIPDTPSPMVNGKKKYAHHHPNRCSSTSSAAHTCSSFRHQNNAVKKCKPVGISSASYHGGLSAASDCASSAKHFLPAVGSSSAPLEMASESGSSNRKRVHEQECLLSRRNRSHEAGSGQERAPPEKAERKRARERLSSRHRCASSTGRAQQGAAPGATATARQSATATARQSATASRSVDSFDDGGAEIRPPGGATVGQRRDGGCAADVAGRGASVGDPSHSDAIVYVGDSMTKRERRGGRRRHPVATPAGGSPHSLGRHRLPGGSAACVSQTSARRHHAAQMSADATRALHDDVCDLTAAATEGGGWLALSPRLTPGPAYPTRPTPGPTYPIRPTPGRTRRRQSRGALHIPHSDTAGNCSLDDVDIVVAIDEIDSVQRQMDADMAMACAMQEEMDREFAIVLDSNQRRDLTDPMDETLDFGPSIHGLVQIGDVMGDDDDDDGLSSPPPGVQTQGRLPASEMARARRAFTTRSPIRVHSRRMPTRRSSSGGRRAANAIFMVSRYLATSMSPSGRRRPRHGRLRTLDHDTSMNDGNNYELYLDLAEALGDATSRGLTRAQISLLPVRAYTPGGATGECPVCMADYERGQRMRILPCFHEFHAPCIDKWIEKNATCPVCRIAVDV